MLALACVAPHDDSWSTTRVHVDGRGVAVDLSVQTLSVIEVVAADEDGDQWLSVEELDAARDDVVRYLLDHHVVTLLDASGVEVAPAWGAPTIERREDLDTLPPRQWLDLRFEAPPLAIDPARVAVDATLFLTTSPGHRAFVDVAWDGAEPEPGVVLWMAETRGALDRPPTPEPPPAPEPEPAPSVSQDETTVARPVDAPPVRLEVLALLAVVVAAWGGGLRAALAGCAVALVGAGARGLVAQHAPHLALAAPAAWVLTALAALALLRRSRLSDRDGRARLLAECLVWGVLISGFGRPVAAASWPATALDAGIWCLWAIVLGCTLQLAPRAAASRPDE